MTQKQAEAELKYRLAKYVLQILLDDDTITAEEMELARKKLCKKIIIVYNAMTKQPHWLPSYMQGYESIAEPFWTKDYWGNKVGNYYFIKKELGYV